MENTKIIRLLADKIMNYPPSYFQDSGAVVIPIGGTGLPVNDSIRREWDPLTSDNDSCMILEKLAENGMCPALSSTVGADWSVTVHKSLKWNDFVTSSNVCRRRAIAIAALKAVGVPDAISE